MKIKRIIEIDEAEYNTIKCSPYSPILAWRVIANSKPYDDSGDLISRSELQKKYDSECTQDCAVCAYHNNKGDTEHCRLIDNAPTVDIKTEVWELYKKRHSSLATYVYEFGLELKELLGIDEEW